MSDGEMEGGCIKGSQEGGTEGRQYGGGKGRGRENRGGGKGGVGGGYASAGGSSAPVLALPYPAVVWRGEAPRPVHAREPVRHLPRRPANDRSQFAPPGGSIRARRSEGRKGSALSVRARASGGAHLRQPVLHFQWRVCVCAFVTARKRGWEGGRGKGKRDGGMDGRQGARERGREKEKGRGRERKGERESGERERGRGAWVRQRQRQRPRQRRARD